MRTRVIVVCVCVCVSSQSASCVGHFYSKLNMAISFSEGFKNTDLSKVVYFKRYYFVPMVQVSHFSICYYCSARVAHGCIAGEGVPC